MRTADREGTIIFTDGACLGNPGPGGYGVVIVQGDHIREISGGFRNTTNNRMEIMAAIAGIEALEGRRQVTLYSDSQYLVNAITNGWAKRWKANRWMRTTTEKALNADLWERLLGLCEDYDIEFKWIRGHAGNDLNERCDTLARQAAKQPDLPRDLGYSPNRPSPHTSQHHQGEYDSSHVTRSRHTQDVSCGGERGEGEPTCSIRNTRDKGEAMQSSDESTSIEVLRSMAERAGLHLNDEELAEIQRIYDPTQLAALRALNLEPLEPASIYIPV